MEKYRKTWRPTRIRTPKSGYLKVSNGKFNAQPWCLGAYLKGAVSLFVFVYIWGR